MVDNIQPNSFMLTNNVSDHFSLQQLASGAGPQRHAYPRWRLYLLRGSSARIHLHIPLRGAYTDPDSYRDSDSYAHANHDTNTDRNTNCDCDHDPYCNIYSHSYTQANAYTKSCSDAAAAAHRATAPILALDVLGDRLLPCSRRQPAGEQFQGSGRAKAVTRAQLFGKLPKRTG